MVKFGLKSESFHFGGSLIECVALLQKMNVSHAIQTDETGLDYSMMSLNLNQSMTVEDDIGREIKITRYKNCDIKQVVMDLNFKVGQKILFTQPMFHKNVGLVSGEIIKVGNKYLYVKGPFREFKFDRKTLREVNGTNYKGCLYLSKEEYSNEKELTNNMREIIKKISEYRLELTLEQTREILKVLSQS